MMDGRQGLVKRGSHAALEGAPTADRAPPRMTPCGARKRHEVCEAMAQESLPRGGWRSLLRGFGLAAANSWLLE